MAAPIAGDEDLLRVELGVLDQFDDLVLAGGKVVAACCSGDNGMVVFVRAR